MPPSLAGRGARYTRMRKPLEMRLAADGLDRAQAQRLEAGIKKLPKTRKIRLVAAKCAAVPVRKKGAVETFRRPFCPAADSLLKNHL